MTLTDRWVRLRSRETEIRQQPKSALHCGVSGRCATPRAGQAGARQPGARGWRRRRRAAAGRAVAVQRRYQRGGGRRFLPAAAVILFTHTHASKRAQTRTHPHCSSRARRRLRPPPPPAREWSLRRGRSGGEPQMMRALQRTLGLCGGSPAWMGANGGDSDAGGSGGGGGSGAAHGGAGSAQHRRAAGASERGGTRTTTTGGQLDGAACGAAAAARACAVPVECDQLGSALAALEDAAAKAATAASAYAGEATSASLAAAQQAQGDARCAATVALAASEASACATLRWQSCFHAQREQCSTTSARDASGGATARASAGASSGTVDASLSTRNAQQPHAPPLPPALLVRHHRTPPEPVAVVRPAAIATPAPSVTPWESASFRPVIRARSARRSRQCEEYSEGAARRHSLELIAYMETLGVLNAEEVASAREANAHSAAGASGSEDALCGGDSTPAPSPCSHPLHASSMLAAAWDLKFISRMVDGVEHPKTGTCRGRALSWAVTAPARQLAGRIHCAWSKVHVAPPLTSCM